MAEGNRMIDVTGRPTIVDGKWMIADSMDWARITFHELKTDSSGRPIAHVRESAVQEIAIYDLLRFGPSLWIRVKGEERFWPQLAWADEHRYHQALVHITLALHSAPKRVLILGGGDHLAAWRAWMCADVEEIVLVDWDPLVAEMVKTHIPDAAATGIFSNRAVRAIDGDVRMFLRSEAAERWDVVIGDLTDIREFRSFLPDFHEQVSRILRPGGIFATQFGEICSTDLDKYAQEMRPFHERFRWVRVGAEHIPSYAYVQGFLYCGKTDAPPTGPLRIVPARIAGERPFFVCPDATTEANRFDETLRWRLFHLNPDVRAALGV